MNGKIYCDLDQVLTDFSESARKVLGKSFDDASLSAIGVLDALQDIPGFWANLPMVTGAKELWERLRPHKPIILTTYPAYMESAVAEKEQWCLERLGVPKERVICLNDRSMKKSYALTRTFEPMGGVRNLLIDDYLPNIQDWNDAGGVGIHHLTFRSTIDQLNKYVWLSQYQPNKLIYTPEVQNQQQTYAR